MKALSILSMAPSLLVLAACGGDQQVRETPEDLPVIEAVTPVVTRDLKADDGALLAVRDLVSDGDALMLLDGPADEVWRLSLRPPYTLERVSRPRRFGQPEVFAMAAHSAGLTFIGVDGTLRVMEPADADMLARTIRAFAPVHRPIALGEWDGRHWVAVHAVTVLRETAVDSVIVSRVAPDGAVSRVYGYERAGRSRPHQFLADPMGARVVAGRVVLVGADPARIITIGDTEVRVDTLLEVPRRELSAKERNGLQRMLDDPRLPATLRNAVLPDRRPAAIAALPFDGGYAVVAQGSEEAQFVDLYCGRAFRRTLLARAGLHDIFVVAGGLVTIDDPPLEAPESPARLSFYRVTDFIAECST